MNYRWVILIILTLLLTACTNNETPAEQPEKQPTTENQSPETKENNEDQAKVEEKIMFPSVELQKKDEGEAVLQLQQALEQISYTIPADGIYSDITTWAITDFQLQTEGLAVTGIYTEETRIALENMLEEETIMEAGLGLPPLAEPVFTNSGSVVTGNPYDQLAVINKQQALPADYEPHDLVVPDVEFPFTEDLPKKQLRAPAALALEKLFEAAADAGHILYAQSGYRSYERQVVLFDAYSREHGEEEANVFSARPGESEHQTGLSMDISSEAVNFQLTTDFGDTPEGKWVAENAHEFGFIIRYPEGKEEITKYQYEPWHLRYVGVRAATAIMQNNLTLEEYFAEDE